MRKEMIIRMQPDSDKRRAKALKVAASVSDTLLLLLLVLHQETKTSPNLLRNDMEARARVTWSSGVQSVTVAGESRDMLLVIGDGVDAGKLTRKLKKEVGEAEILELRTHPATGSTNALTPVSSTVITQSAYQRHPTPGPSVPGGGRIECPVAAAAAAAAAAWWPGEHGRQAFGYYHRTLSSGYYYHQSSPMVVGQGGYGYAGGRSYALEVARSHPANYSPMIARHDFRAVGRPGDAGGRREHGGGGGPNCCSIL